MDELVRAAREQIGLGFGTAQGAWLIRTFIQPLDHFVYQVSDGRLLFLNAFLPTMMLVSTGAKSGQLRTVPLLYLRAGSNYVVIASNYGSTSHPSWYHNLRANPACSVQLDGRSIACVARETEGSEREALWRRALVLYSGYQVYQARAGERRIPVIVLEPAAVS